ncbi:MAG: UbiH/UbiF/VisC/COQ6 family ubiquinone biosynthesis hydroxylase [Pseudomonadota bacterium]
MTPPETEPPPQTDIAIVGGGLVGPALALALARLGLRVVLVDRLAEPVRRDPAFDGRAYAVALGSSRVLAALGLWSELEPLAQPIADIRVSEGQPGAYPGAALHFDPRASDEGRVGWILEDRFLRRALLEAVAAEEGITHRAPAEVVAADLEGPAARLTLSDGQVIAAPLAVGADGRRSPLGAMAGIGRQVLRYDQVGLVASIEHKGDHEGVARQSFFPGGPFAVLPLPGGHRSSLVWSERTRAAEALMRLDDAAYTKALQARIGAGLSTGLGKIALAGPRRSHPLDLSLADSYAGPRVVLVGDAAHGVHPIAGQGFNLGLRDVAALTEVLTEGARAGRDLGEPALLQDYERWRRFDNVSFALGMDALNRLFSNANPLARAVRGLGLGLVDRCPPATRFFMREATGLSGQTPAMMRGELP